MANVVVTIPVRDLRVGDWIFVPLTIPPTVVKYWKISATPSEDVVELHCMEEKNFGICVLKKTDLIQVVR